MKDRTCRHYSDYNGTEQLELSVDNEKNVSITIGNISIFEPVLQITFRKEGIQEIIEDLQNLIQ